MKRVDKQTPEKLSSEGPKTKRAKHDESEQSSSTHEEKQQKEDITSSFMALAHLVAQRSGDPVTKVGACIVNNKEEIVAVGFNHLPKGMDPKFWLKKKLHVIHAEKAALDILSNDSRPTDLKGCSIYVTLHPCDVCAQLIIDSGIKKVAYFSSEKNNKPKFIRSNSMLKKADVEVRHYNLQDRVLDELDKAKGGVEKNATRDAAA